MSLNRYVPESVIQALESGMQFNALQRGKRGTPKTQTGDDLHIQVADGDLIARVRLDEHNILRAKGKGQRNQYVNIVGTLNDARGLRVTFKVDELTDEARIKTKAKAIAKAANFYNKWADELNNIPQKGKRYDQIATKKAAYWERLVALAGSTQEAERLADEAKLKWYEQLQEQAREAEVKAKELADRMAAKLKS